MKNPITKQEFEEFKKSVHVGDLMKIPVMVYDPDDGGAPGERMEYCIVDEIYPYVVLFERGSGLKTSISFQELCVLHRYEVEERARKLEEEKALEARAS